MVSHPEAAVGEGWPRTGRGSVETRALTRDWPNTYKKLRLRTIHLVSQRGPRIERRLWLSFCMLPLIVTLLPSYPDRSSSGHAMTHRCEVSALHLRFSSWMLLFSVDVI